MLNIHHIKSDETFHQIHIKNDEFLNINKEIDTYIEYSDDDYSDPSLNDDTDDEIFINNFGIPIEFEFFCSNIEDSKPIELYQDMLLILQNEELKKSISFNNIEDIQGVQIKELRFLLADWIFQLSFAYPTNSDTLFQCFSIIDRYLSKKNTFIHKLQLIGCCCLWISSKMDFHATSTLEPLFKFCHGKFSKEDFINTENEILKEVDYFIQTSSAYFFLRQFNEKIGGNDLLFAIAAYYAEISLYYVNFSNYRQSLIAYCSILNASQHFKIDLTPLNIYIKDFSQVDINNCCNYLIKSSKIIIEKEKYGVNKKFQMRCKDDNRKKYIVNGFGLFRPFTK